MPDRRESALNRSMYLSNVGECTPSLALRYRNEITDQLVMQNAANIPADMVSSKYENGTKVAMSTMTVPEYNVPFQRLPVPSTSASTGGSRPSLATAHCKRGWAKIDISTTMGRVITSPALAICAAHSLPLYRNASGKPDSPLMVRYGCIPTRTDEASMYRIVTMPMVQMTARGMFRWGSIASPARQQASSKPMYPKKQLVAPRNTPPGPNSGGISGAKFEASA
mmetsp:Transcript_3204/g.6946  ORF Transcript_3204/g.6946 Transcript_3204/m.6946 type:complete len:224 (-) Transcript_3204:430-1101(-)